MTFVAGAPSATTSTLTASPAPVTADGSSTTTLTVTVEDAHGNAVGNTAVTLSASGIGNTFGTISGTTNAQGVFTTTLASTMAQTETITATEGSAQETTSVTFVRRCGLGFEVDAGCQPDHGDGGRQFDDDADGDGGGCRRQSALRRHGDAVGKWHWQQLPSPITGTTNGNGVFTTMLSATAVQDDTFTAQTNGTAVTETATVDFVAGARSRLRRRRWLPARPR